jgi:hypothetical protein
VRYFLFLCEKFKNVDYYMMKWKNHEFVVVVLKTRWHIGKRKMGLLLMGGEVKWSFPLSIWHRYLRKWTEWLAGQRSLGGWHVGVNELFSGTQVSSNFRNGVQVKDSMWSVPHVLPRPTSVQKCGNWGHITLHLCSFEARLVRELKVLGPFQGLLGALNVDYLQN